MYVCTYFMYVCQHGTCTLSIMQTHEGLWINVCICFPSHLTIILQVSQLNTLINLLLGDLTKADRQRICTICTIDVHARDVVQKMIKQKVENAQAFTWLSQLRHR